MVDRVPFSGKAFVLEGQPGQLSCLGLNLLLPWDTDIIKIAHLIFNVLFIYVEIVLITSVFHLSPSCLLGRVVWEQTFFYFTRPWERIKAVKSVTELMFINISTYPYYGPGTNITSRTILPTTAVGLTSSLPRLFPRRFEVYDWAFFSAPSPPHLGRVSNALRGPSIKY